MYISIYLFHSNPFYMSNSIYLYIYILPTLLSIYLWSINVISSWLCWDKNILCVLLHYPQSESPNSPLLKGRGGVLPPHPCLAPIYPSPRPLSRPMIMFDRIRLLFVLLQGGCNKEITIHICIHLYYFLSKKQHN